MLIETLQIVSAIVPYEIKIMLMTGVVLLIYFTINEKDKKDNEKK